MLHIQDSLKTSLQVRYCVSSTHEEKQSKEHQVLDQVGITHSQ